MSEERKKKLEDRYGASEEGNFHIIDTIGVPHPFTIGPRHIKHAQEFDGILSEACIEHLEKELRGPSCAHRRCNLKYKEHEQALLISCKMEIKQEDGQAVPELQSYLLKCKPLCEEDKYAGFAFIRE